MLTLHFKSCIASTYQSQYGHLFLILILITNLHGFSDADTNGASHFNFFRGTLRGRQRVLTCKNDPDVCSDRDKNPWGGSTSTCCFQMFCKDTASDSNHCGECGKKCGFGLVCCDGKCIDIQRDSMHCGACFEVCPGKSSCSFAMCDYGD